MNNLKEMVDPKSPFSELSPRTDGFLGVTTSSLPILRKREDPKCYMVI